MSFNFSMRVEIIDNSHQKFNDKIYKLSEKGYYYALGFYALHIDVWKYHHGENSIPKGYHVHHKNFNKADNNIENLQLLTHSEHSKLHGLARPFIKHICENCGKAFFSRKRHVKAIRFCSNKCKGEWQRASGKYNEQRICMVCGNKFMVYKYDKTMTCSHECRSKIRKRRANGQFAHNDGQ